MGWFKKEKKEIVEEEIPELPELPDPDDFSLSGLPNPNEFSLPKPSKPSKPALSEFPVSNFEVDFRNLPQLPPLPELKNKNFVHPTVIKQEVVRPHQEMQRSQFRVVENRPRQESYLREPSLIREPPEIDEISSAPVTQVKNNTEPIYVRLDKFETSLQSIEEIKRKIQEVEKILKETKEIKQKEEQELEAWEKEVHIIKTRIGAIDKDIFNKFD